MPGRATGRASAVVNRSDTARVHVSRTHHVPVSYRTYLTEPFADRRGVGSAPPGHRQAPRTGERACPCPSLPWNPGVPDAPWRLAPIGLEVLADRTSSCPGRSGNPDHPTLPHQPGVSAGSSQWTVRAVPSRASSPPDHHATLVPRRSDTGPAGDPWRPRRRPKAGGSMRETSPEAPSRIRLRDPTIATRCDVIVRTVRRVRTDPSPSRTRPGK